MTFCCAGLSWHALSAMRICERTVASTCAHVVLDDAAAFHDLSSA